LGLLVQVWDIFFEVFAEALSVFILRLLGLGDLFLHEGSVGVCEFPVALIDLDGELLGEVLEELDVDVLAEVVVPVFLDSFKEGLKAALVPHGLTLLGQAVLGVLEHSAQAFRALGQQNGHQVVELVESLTEQAVDEGFELLSLKFEERDVLLVLDVGHLEFDCAKVVQKGVDFLVGTFPLLIYVQLDKGIDHVQPLLEGQVLELVQLLLADCSDAHDLILEELLLGVGADLLGNVAFIHALLPALVLLDRELLAEGAVLVE